MTDLVTVYTGMDFYCDVAIPKRVPLRIEYESDSVLAFVHTRPCWAVYIVVVPKKHIASFTTLSEEDTPILLELFEALKKIAARVEHDFGGARILTNLGYYQDSKHLHFHVNSGHQLR